MGIYDCRNKNVLSSRRNRGTYVSHAIMSGGRLFHSRAPAIAKVRSPTVAHSDLPVCLTCESVDRGGRLISCRSSSSSKCAADAARCCWPSVAEAAGDAVQYRVGQIKRHELASLPATSERIYRIEWFLTSTNNVKQLMARCRYPQNWKRNTL